ncbi:5'-nucleotidase C-terminal domain-containing protein [Mycoplasmatota bacterium]|nr:5'-nucleotidase C-terminal domain-containing protein [Mycoplasmatota bacterium]
MKKKFLILNLLLLVSILLLGCENLNINLTTTTITSTTETETTTTDTTTLNTITEIKSGMVGDIYTTRATVVGTTTKGVLIYDGNDFIYVFLNSMPMVSVNDYVEVTGVTSEDSGVVQYGTGSTISKISTEEGYTFEATELSGNEVTTYGKAFSVGDYIRLTGTLTISGDYQNLFIPGTGVVVSLYTNDTSLSLSEMSGDTITVEGYMLNVSGSNTQYWNLLVTDVNEETVINDSFPLTILTVNDLHGYIEQEEDGTDGLSNMSYLINEIRNTNSLDDVVLIANGDMFQGTSISNMTNGLAVLECMNEMGFDAMGIGNHEFDWEIGTILDYFDKDESNGEAYFPLLNANIYLTSDDSLLTVSGGNVLDSVVVEREGVEVGIISYVGNVYSSIAYDKVDDYYFDLDIADSVREIAGALKQSSVDVIVVNIHGGKSNDTALAYLKDENGDYLVDAVINGHTHSYQMGAISRDNGLEMPYIQAGSSGNYFGKITLTIDLSSMDVTEYTEDIIDVSLAGTKYDSMVEEIIDDYSEELGNEVLAISGETITSKSQLFDWTGNVMLEATGADIAISNKGGIRSTGGITAGENVTLNQMYEVSPFDNTIWLIEGTYTQIEELLNSSSVYYTLADDVVLNYSETYTVAIISYVYYWDQLDSVRSSSDTDTGVYIRDILAEDIKIKGLADQLFSPITNPEASIGLKYVSTP